jgi:hypothetical protein
MRRGEKGDPGCGNVILRSRIEGTSLADASARTGPSLAGVSRKANGWALERRRISAFRARAPRAGLPSGAFRRDVTSGVVPIDEGSGTYLLGRKSSPLRVGGLCAIEAPASLPRPPNFSSPYFSRYSRMKAMVA